MGETEDNISAMLGELQKANQERQARVDKMLADERKYGGLSDAAEEENGNGSTNQPAEVKSKNTSEASAENQSSPNTELSASELAAKIPATEIIKKDDWHNALGLEDFLEQVKYAGFDEDLDGLIARFEEFKKIRQEASASAKNLNQQMVALRAQVGDEQAQRDKNYKKMSIQKMSALNKAAAIKEMLDIVVDDPAFKTVREIQLNRAKAASVNEVAAAQRDQTANVEQANTAAKNAEDQTTAPQVKAGENNDIPVKTSENTLKDGEKDEVGEKTSAAETARPEEAQNDVETEIAGPVEWLNPPDIENSITIGYHRLELLGNYEDLLPGTYLTMRETPAEGKSLLVDIIANGWIEKENGEDEKDNSAQKLQKLKDKYKNGLGIVSSIRNFTKNGRKYTTIATENGNTFQLESKGYFHAGQDAKKSRQKNEEAIDAVAAAQKKQATEADKEIEKTEDAFKRLKEKREYINATRAVVEIALHAVVNKTESGKKEATEQLDVDKIEGRFGPLRLLVEGWQEKEYQAFGREDITQTIKRKLTDLIVSGSQEYAALLNTCGGNIDKLPSAHAETMRLMRQELDRTIATYLDFVAIDKQREANDKNKEFQNKIVIDHKIARQYNMELRNLRKEPQTKARRNRIKELEESLATIDKSIKIKRTAITENEQDARQLALIQMIFRTQGQNVVSSDEVDDSEWGFMYNLTNNEFYASMIASKKNILTAFVGELKKNPPAGFNESKDDFSAVSGRLSEIIAQMEHVSTVANKTRKGSKLSTEHIGNVFQYEAQYGVNGDDAAFIQFLAMEKMLESQQTLLKSKTAIAEVLNQAQEDQNNKDKKLAEAANYFHMQRQFIKNVDTMWDLAVAGTYNFRTINLSAGMSYFEELFGRAGANRRPGAAW